MAKKRAGAGALAVATSVAGVGPTEAELQDDMNAEMDTSAATQTVRPNGGGLQVIGDGGNGEHRAQPTEQVIFEIDPENILIDPDLRALRSWGNNAAHELTLPALARTMYEEGQQYPALMFQTDEGLVLYEGHRRQQASVIIREEWDATWMLKAIVVPDMTKERALRMACLADSQHEKFGPLQVGRNIQFIRKHFNWVGGEHTVDVAEFLGVSPATITQMERLAKAPAEIQKKVEMGWSPTAALDLISTTSKVSEEERPAAQAAVVERAQELANQERESKKKGKGKGNGDESKRTPVTKEQAVIAKRAQESAKKDREAREALASDAKRHVLDGAEQTTDPALLTDTTDADALDAAGEVEEAEAQASVISGPAPVTGKHVRQAARQVLADPKLKAPKMSEAIELIEPWSGPAYPDVMGKFAGVFADWGRGKTSNKQLEAAWDDIADALSGVVKPASAKSGKTAVTKKVTAPKKKATPAKKAAAVKKTAPTSKKKASPKKK